MRLNAKQIASYTGGTFSVQPIDASALMNDVTWGSRDVRRGSLYVALPGNRVDGHDFVDAALRAGAYAALVMQPLPEATCVLARELGAAVIEVPDTAAAITDLARAWRKHLRGKVVAVTGSTGKTTTKNLVRDVLSARGSVVATVANQNNELGVPKTLLSADPETEAIVVEMGMRGLGQIESLCDFVLPDWGLITNVGESHIELLGSRENIARAKAELLCALPKKTGVAFLNGACALSDFMWDASGLAAWGNVRVTFDGESGASGRLSATAVSDGLAHPAVWAEDVRLDAQGRPTFTLCASGFTAAWPASADATPVERQACQLGLRGVHNVSNACSAAAVGRAFGMSLAVIAEALENALPEAGRQEVLRARGGFTVVNDAYNANPDSMRAALSTFCALSVSGRRVAVLGDMGELGSYARACHEGVGAFAAQLPLDRLLCVGELAQHIAQGALAAGMGASRVSCMRGIPDTLGELEAWLEPGDAVLVKASHFMELARVVEGLVS